MTTESKPSRLTHPLREGDEVTLVNGEVHNLTRKSDGDFEGNTPYYRWDENGEIAHAAMSYDDNRYEIVRHVETTATGTAIAEDNANHWCNVCHKWTGHTTGGHVEADIAIAATPPEPGAGGAGDEQRAFEDWLDATCPSGDAESIRRQWEASSAFREWHDKPAPAPGLTPTPRTDAIDYANPRPGEVAAHARTLERELAEARAEVERLTNNVVAYPLYARTRDELFELREANDGLEQSAAGMRKALEGIKVRCQDASRELIGVHGMDMHKQRLALIYDAIEQALAGASGDGKEEADTHAEIAAGLPFVVPPFALPDRLKNTEYAWFSWHPCYPYWSESCFTGASVEEAQKWKTAGTSAKMRIYWNKLVRKDGDRSEVVEDWLGDEALSNWEIHRRMHDSGEREYKAVPQPPAGRAGA